MLSAAYWGSIAVKGSLCLGLHKEHSVSDKESQTVGGIPA